jgi:exoribonuclease R
MIPPRLSTQICSLRDQVDRLAFSCIWTLDADANIIETKFVKSVIRSHAAMAYADAQKHIDVRLSPVTKISILYTKKLSFFLFYRKIR